MNGFISLPRIVRGASFLASLTLLACTMPSHAASWMKSDSSTSTIPTGLRDAIDQTLGGGWVQMQQVTETSTGFTPEFGVSVAIHGTTAMVGAQQQKVGDNDDQGAVFVYQQIDGVWTMTQQLLADDGGPGDTFGDAVAFDGTTAVIGAYAASLDGVPLGAAYVYTLADGTWTQSQKLTADDSDPGHSLNFGFSVGLSGSTIMIGADAATVGTNDFQGAVYVFNEAGGTWTQSQKLSGDDAGIGDIFGISLAFDGTTLVVGAYSQNQSTGAAYVFNNAGGTWSQTQKLVADNAATNTYFGGSVAVSDQTILIGSWGANPGGVDTQGAAYIFTNTGGTWTQTQELIADDGTVQDKFGHSVALQGTTALIAADGSAGPAGPGAGTANGAVYSFDGTGGTWTQTQKFYANDGQPSFQFGFPLALDGDMALVGSWLWISPEGALQGSAYFFEFGGTPPPTYTIGGHVDGLAGSGLVLQQSGHDDLSISADGDFTFATPLDDGATYAVTVSTQPGNPSQTCTVANGSGTVAGADVTDVAVTCTTDIVDSIFKNGFDTGGSTGGSATLAQTTDMTPVDTNSVACGNNDDGTTADNNYWRRYYFNEYSVTSAASVTSVDVAVQSTTGSPSITVTLYATPHSVAVDTIDEGQLNQIGQAIVAAPSDSGLASINVPITGTVADTVGFDLVVEVSTDDFAGTGTAFYIGSTPSAETHPSFISSEACGTLDPTPTAGIGFPDMHIIEAVNIND
jgi:hypothetical protein